jgi:hypothetical protein
MHKGEFVFGCVSEVKLPAKVPLDRLPYPCDQVFSGGGDCNSIRILLQANDSFQRPFLASLSFYIPNARQKLLPVAFRKSTAKLHDASNLAVSNRLACRTEFHVSCLFFARSSQFPDAVLKQKIAFRTSGIRRIFL